MGRLKTTIATALVALTLAVATPSAAQAPSRWQPFVAEASDRFGIPVAWIRRVMTIESGQRAQLGGRPIRSAKGAIGPMQLMPATWHDMRTAYDLGADPDDPRDNILAGTAYLRLMYDRFGYPGLFGAYNAGPARYAAWLAGTAPLPRETAAYMTRATAGGGAVAGRVTDYRRAPASSLFAIAPRTVPATAGPLPDAPAGLFAVGGTSPPQPGR